jgi:hypothetical protein
VNSTIEIGNAGDRFALALRQHSALAEPVVATELSGPALVDATTWLEKRSRGFAQFVVTSFSKSGSKTVPVE